jgi:hypothetical protein
MRKRSVAWGTLGGTHLWRVDVRRCVVVLIVVLNHNRVAPAYRQDVLRHKAKQHIEWCPNHSNSNYIKCKNTWSYTCIRAGHVEAQGQQTERVVS